MTLFERASRIPILDGDMCAQDETTQVTRSGEQIDKRSDMATIWTIRYKYSMAMNGGSCEYNYDATPQEKATFTRFCRKAIEQYKHIPDWMDT